MTKSNITPNALDLLKKRYFKEGETNFNQLANRVSIAVADAEATSELKEKWGKIFYDMISELEFIPSTPCLTNADIKEPGQLSSCFIISLKDTIESIYQAKAECAKIFQKNGGVGFNISVLRPQGCVVETSKGYSCGPIGFMEEFDITADVVTRNNARKGAIKVDLNDWHPDILNFISCKDEPGKLERMNISVSLSNNFMEAVEKDEDWHLKFPDYISYKQIYDEEWDGDIEKWEDKEYPVKLYKTIKARELYDKIIEHSWRTGEPGVSFRDLMDKDNPNPHLGKIFATNPCLTGDMKILTDKGYIEIGSLNGQSVKIINKDGRISDGKVWLSGKKETVIIKPLGRKPIKSTSDHIFLTTTNEEVQAKNLKGKKLMPTTFCVNNTQANQEDSFTLINFLQEIYSKNGFILANDRITYKTNSAKFAEKLIKVLKNFEIEVDNIVEDDIYYISIHSFDSIQKFQYYIGFHDIVRKKELHNLLIFKSPVILDITEGPVEEVYDFSEPELNWGIVEGFVAHNCSEFSSIAYNSCNLGSINLTKFVEKGQMNWRKLERLVRSSIRFLDNMITVNKLPLTTINAITKGVRSIGLGVMGFADMLFLLKIKYDSEEAYQFSNILFENIKGFAILASMELAEEKESYLFYRGSTWEDKKIKIRNSNVLSIAPTGSISFLANVSGGIEPLFALVYSRRTAEGDIYYVVNDIFEQELKKRGLYNEELLIKITENHGSCKGIDSIPLDMQNIFVTSHDIEPRDHIQMVGIIQKHVDLSISKTVNLSNKATIETVKDVYKQAYSLGIKGITVYRDGSRKNQTLSTQREEEIQRIMRGDWKSKASDTIYLPKKVYIGCGKVILFIGWSESEKTIQDFYIKRSGQGGCERNLENMTIAMSGMLRLGGSLFNIEKAFEGVGGCNSFVSQRAKGGRLSRGNNCGNAILYSIREFLNTIENKKIAKQEDTENSCPECGEIIVLESGCISCKGCGYSKC